MKILCEAYQDAKGCITIQPKRKDLRRAFKRATGHQNAFLQSEEEVEKVTKGKTWDTWEIVRLYANSEDLNAWYKLPS